MFKKYFLSVLGLDFFSFVFYYGLILQICVYTILFSKEVSISKRIYDCFCSFVVINVFS